MYDSIYIQNLSMRYLVYDLILTQKMYIYIYIIVYICNTNKLLDAALGR